MKRSQILGIAGVVLVIAITASVVLAAVAGARRQASEAYPRIVRGRGYVRGLAMYSLQNKYAAFVSKVNFYSYQSVKAGDVIIEYDDFDLRVKLEAKRNAVAEQEKLVESRELELAKIRLDPLPSNYRNINYKQMAAEEKLKRLRHELSVYTKLHGNNIVSDLSLREKIQDCKDAEAEVKSNAHDISVVKQGLAENYVAAAEKDLETAKTKLEGLRRELALLEEEQQYYRIVSPCDGVVIVNSSTVGSWNAVGTTAVEVHRIPNGKKLVYCYVDERDIHNIIEGRQYRWRSAQFDAREKGFALVTAYELKKSHYTYGDRSLYLVNCRVDSSPEDLRIGSTGSLEIDVPAGN